MQEGDLSVKLTKAAAAMPPKWILVEHKKGRTYDTEPTQDHKQSTDEWWMNRDTMMMHIHLVAVRTSTQSHNLIGLPDWWWWWCRSRGYMDKID